MLKFLVLSAFCIAATVAVPTPFCPNDEVGSPIQLAGRVIATTFTLPEKCDEATSAIGNQGPSQTFPYNVQNTPAVGKWFANQPADIPVDGTYTGYSSYYWISEGYLSWPKADHFCKYRFPLLRDVVGTFNYFSSTLARVESKAENLYLASTFKKLFPNTRQNLWIGGWRPSSSNATWYWTSSAKRGQTANQVLDTANTQDSYTITNFLASYENCTKGVNCLWNQNRAKSTKVPRPSEPNNLNGDEYCIAMNNAKLATNPGAWRDESCGDKNRFVCKVSYNNYVNPSPMAFSQPVQVGMSMGNVATEGVPMAVLENTLLNAVTASLGVDASTISNFVVTINQSRRRAGGTRVSVTFTYTPTLPTEVPNVAQLQTSLSTNMLTNLVSSPVFANAQPPIVVAAAVPPPVVVTAANASPAAAAPMSCPAASLAYQTQQVYACAMASGAFTGSCAGPCTSAQASVCTAMSGLTLGCSAPTTTTTTTTKATTTTQAPTTTTEAGSGAQ